MMLCSRRTVLTGLAAGLTTAALGAAREAAANSPDAYTTIQVHNMHCGECAKKIARKLYAVPGVVEVRADVQKNMAYVVPQAGKSPAPRSLWEAVEAAGFQVARLTGPQGDFTAKPR
jgi:copper chaperone CopZ